MTEPLKGYFLRRGAALGMVNTRYKCAKPNSSLLPSNDRDVPLLNYAKETEREGKKNKAKSNESLTYAKQVDGKRWTQPLCLCTDPFSLTKSHYCVRLLLTIF